MSQALRNEDVTVFGDGSQTRSFTYITDLVDGIIKLMLSSENDPINIGNPLEMTIKEIAETIIKMTGSKSKIVYRPLPTDDPKQRSPDITRARTLLGWEPKVALEEGLVKTIEYFRTRIKENRTPDRRPRAKFVRAASQWSTSGGAKPGGGATRRPSQGGGQWPRPQSRNVSRLSDPEKPGRCLRDFRYPGAPGGGLKSRGIDGRLEAQRKGAPKRVR